MISSRVRHNKTHPNGHHDVHARPENTDRTKDKKISYLGGIPVRLVLVGRPRRPTDRRRSSDEHTNKREVELTSISQQTPGKGTPLFLAYPRLQPHVRHLRPSCPLKSIVYPESSRQHRSPAVNTQSDFAVPPARRSRITQTSPFDQMGRCSGQNGSTRRAN